MRNLPTEKKQVQGLGIISRISRALSRAPVAKEVTLKRVIIEGGYQDDWARHTIDPHCKFDIPQEVTRLKIGSHYSLDLVARLDREGNPVIVNTPEEKSVEMDLPYNYFFRIQRPTTVIVEDMRIYHDRSLLADEFNGQRLKSLLDVLMKKYGGGGINQIFEQKQLDS